MPSTASPRSQSSMESVTVTRIFEVPGCARSNGFLCTWPHVHRSARFPAGGYDWSLLYYPYSMQYDLDSVEFCLQLETKGVKVTASLSLGLLDPTAAMPLWNLTTSNIPFELSSDTGACIIETLPMSTLGMPPAPGYLTRGGLLFQCIITVFTNTPAQMPAMPSSQGNRVPASDMMQKLGKLYTSKDGSDVTYSVGGELFRAHKIILAMRSPVFYAELYGGMMESKAQLIQVEDMRHDVFGALLCYMYTDALPATDGQVNDGDAIEMMCSLLMAADRYDVERLRLMCEHELCKMVNVDNVANMLAFADDQHCNMLKDACIVFMTTLGKMEEVMASEGYKQLRSKRPLIFVEVLEKSSKFRRV